MYKLITGEIYRLLHKKSLCIYFLILGAGYFILAFIRSGGFDENSVISDANNFIGLLPALAGGFLFSAIYTDDLNSRNLITIVGYGINKAKIAIAKLILMALFSTVVFGLTPLLLYIIHALFGYPATASTMTIIYSVSCKYLLMTIAYAALSGIVVYGMQRTTFAIVLYILLSFNVVGGLITIILSGIMGSEPASIVLSRLMNGITDRVLTGMVSGNLPALPLIEYIIYIVTALILSVFAFYKKEMEM
jgi:ABC-type transport system involved in multi-copper enzyme maturation permease subunit